MTNAFAIALAAALITTAAIKATPALAETRAVETNISRVQTTDLDLRSDAGRRQLDLRLARAARQLCGMASDADLSGKNAVRKCRAEILAGARGKRDRILAAADRRGEPILVASTR